MLVEILKLMSHEFGLKLKCMFKLKIQLFSSSDKDQLAEEEDDELKEVLDLRKIAVQLLQQEQQNR